MSTPTKVLVIAALVVAAGAGVYLVIRARAPASPQAVLGMVRQTEIRISPETTGGLAALTVRPGDAVRKGEILAILDNPELSASVEEARAALASAKAERDRIYSGVRAEEISIAAQAVRTAEANLVLAKADNGRIATLAAQGHASGAQLDESNASLAKATADADLKRAGYEADRAGPIAEERALADAQVALAQASLAADEAQLAKTKLISPVNGIMGVQVAEPRVCPHKFAWSGLS